MGGGGRVAADPPAQLRHPAELPRGTPRMGSERGSRRRLGGCLREGRAHREWWADHRHARRAPALSELGAGRGLQAREAARHQRLRAACAGPGRRDPAQAHQLRALLRRADGDAMVTHQTGDFAPNPLRVLR